MKFWPYMVIAGLATPLAAPLAAQTPERAMLFVEAVRANDCAMTVDEANQALPGLDLGMDETQEVIDLLFAAGLADFDPEREALVLPEAFCTASDEETLAQVTAALEAPPIALMPWVPDFEPGRAALLIGALRDNDCSMNETEAGELLPQLGLEMNETRDIAGVLFESGLAELSEDGNVLTLSPALCAADPAEDALRAAEALAAFNEAAQAMSDADPGEVLNQQLGPDGVRAMTELYVELEGCSVPLGDRAATEAAIADFVAGQINLTFNLDPDWPEAATADLRRMVGAVIDEPGANFERDGDSLTLINCTP